MLSLNPEISSYSIFDPDNSILFEFRNGWAGAQLANGKTVDKWSVRLCETTDPGLFFRHSDFADTEEEKYGEENYGFGYFSETNPDPLFGKDFSEINILIKVSASALSRIRDTLLSGAHPEIFMSIFPSPAFQPKDSTPLPEYIWDTSKGLILARLDLVKFSKKTESNDKPSLFIESPNNLNIGAARQNIESSTKLQASILAVLLLLLACNILELAL